MNFFESVITDQAKQYVMDVLDSGHLSEGSYVQRFEDRLTQMFGYDWCVAVNSGTSALHLALVLSGVGEGDEVILPAQTFVATGHAILYQGAKPVFADIDIDTGNISPDDIIHRITPRTKAVICVSWGGTPCRLQELSTLCSKYGLKLIQDNAQALGAMYSDEPVTHWGDFSCFSFQATKHLTTGDGGLLVCSNRIDYENARRLRWFGIDRELHKPSFTGERLYNLTRVGYKYHMNDVSAAIGLGNIVGLRWRMARRNNIADIYDRFIKNKNVRLVNRDGSSNWLYTVLVQEMNRLIQKMKDKDVPVSVVHVGIDRNDVFGWGQDLPNQKYWDWHHICLPIHSSLTDEDVMKVIDIVNGEW